MKSRSKSSQAIFADSERTLFWLMLAETIAYAISAFTLYGLSHLVGRASAMNYEGERTYHVRPDGSRETIQSTYAQEEVGKVIPQRPIRRPLIRPMNAYTKRVDQPTRRENLSTVPEKTPEKFTKKKTQER